MTGRDPQELHAWDVNVLNSCRTTSRWRVSCGKFLANQFRLLLSAAAYVLVETLRREALAEIELAAAQAGTIRLKLFKVADRVAVSVHQMPSIRDGPYEDIRCRNGAIRLVGLGLTHVKEYNT